MSNAKSDKLEKVGYLGIALFGILFVLVSSASNHFAQAQNNDNSCNSSLTSPSAGVIISGPANSTACTLPLALSNNSILYEKTTTVVTKAISPTQTYIQTTGHGNLTIPETNQSMNMTTVAYGITSGKNPIYAYGHELVRGQDGSETGINFYKAVEYNPSSPGGKGVSIAVFDGNGTGSFTSLNGVVLVGTQNEDPSDPGAATVTYWKWLPGIGLTLNRVS